MITSVLTRGNQTTIPEVVVKAMGLAPAALLIYEIEDGRVILTAKTATFKFLAGSFPKKPRKRSVTPAEMDSAVKDGIIARFRRSSS
jgi:bifunctional DNA-binding transcriptional regulator/antitoxin component of YhaV-PrlF toxin-antitoxin module